MTSLQASRKYLDYNSTTPPVAGLLDVVAPFLSGEFGNPSSTSSALGRRASAAVENARGQLCALLSCKTPELVFLGCGTESIFHALVGAFLAMPTKKHLIISAVEHPAVFQAAHFLERLLDVRLTRVPVEPDGSLEISRVYDAIESDTGLMSFMLANNETGVVYPIRALAEMCQARGILLHSDATQAIGKIPVSFEDLGVDLLSLTGHKFGAPKGIGALLIRENTSWQAVMKGGGQEQGRRGGTESVPLIVGMGFAAAQAERHLAAGGELKVRQVRDSFESILRTSLSGCEVNAGAALRLPNTTSLRFSGVLAKDLIECLAEHDFVFSAGSACKTGSVEPSHVLRAMALSTSECLETVRISFGPDHEIGDIPEIAKMFSEAVSQLRERAKQDVSKLLTRR